MWVIVILLRDIILHNYKNSSLIITLMCCVWVSVYFIMIFIASSWQTLLSNRICCQITKQITNVAIKCLLIITNRTLNLLCLFIVFVLCSAIVYYWWIFKMFLYWIRVLYVGIYAHILWWYIQVWLSHIPHLSNMNVLVIASMCGCREYLNRLPVIFVGVFLMALDSINRFLLANAMFLWQSIHLSCLVFLPLFVMSNSISLSLSLKLYNFFIKSIYC